MKSKLLLHLCFVSCFTAATVDGTSLFTLKKLAAHPTKLKEVVSKLSNYTKEQRKTAMKLQYDKIQHKIISILREDTTTPLSKLEHLAYPQRGIQKQQLLKKLQIELEQLKIVFFALIGYEPQKSNQKPLSIIAEESSSITSELESSSLATESSATVTPEPARPKTPVNILLHNDESSEFDDSDNFSDNGPRPVQFSKSNQ